MTAITRDVKEGIGPDGINVRLYTHDGQKLPSVTTVLKTRDEDTSNLEAWKERNDGKGDNAFHKHLYWYARHRGTLAHFHALKKLDEDLQWSPDEGDSVYQLENVHNLNDKNVDYEVHDSSPKEVLYSVLKNQHSVESWGEFYDRYPPNQSHRYYSEALIAQKERDVDFFVDTFQHICDVLDLTEDNVIEVERYLFDTEYGYAGQVDMILEYPNGDTVIADLKTKKGAYDKEKLQGVAYGEAAVRTDDIPVDEIDRTEVWCIHPDTGLWSIFCDDASVSPLHTSKYWDEDYDELWNEFRTLVEEFEYTENA